MTFIHDDFLLNSAAAKHLYHTYAADLPIIDYHCHLSPQDIAQNRRFSNLTEIWLEGDHYKWRIMRANGIAERYCTGDASPYDKFLAWSRTVPLCLRNPLHHWTHLELKRYFGFDGLLDERSAPAVWSVANSKLAQPEFTTAGILEHFSVETLCTTDEPADSLEFHEAIAKSPLRTKVCPTFRPDRALQPHETGPFNEWLDRLAGTANVDIGRLADLLEALSRRHQAFHDLGARLSDHGLERCYSLDASESQASAVFDKARSKHPVTLEEREVFASYMMMFFGRLDTEKGWTKQLHLGARRDASRLAFMTLGRDRGFDSIGDLPQIEALGRYLDRLEQQHALPKLIVYNINPADNYAVAAMLGNFQDGNIPGKLQLGSGWWFLDQKEGIEWQLNALSVNGILAHFVGMLTDSRSFMSYPRHEYFRRILCNILGSEMERGEIPNDEQIVGDLVERVCYRNARDYFGLFVTN